MFNYNIYTQVGLIITAIALVVYGFNRYTNSIIDSVSKANEKEVKIYRANIDQLKKNNELLSEALKIQRDSHDATLKTISIEKNTTKRILDLESNILSALGKINDLADKKEEVVEVETFKEKKISKIENTTINKLKKADSIMKQLGYKGLTVKTQKAISRKLRKDNVNSKENIDAMWKIYNDVK